ncbi:glycoside hydrolase family 97 catalytic domain-containing protein [Lewinella sp. LCG006]|uniref:glycoside hydrolase family 97 protein n=1 Tax=Lewinella sp. LCG006 TaxID=3231911 RepID=UPI00345F89B2
MMMNKIVWGCLVLCCQLVYSCNPGQGEVAMTDENQQIQVKLGMTEQGQPFYQLYYQDKMVLDTSYLGLKLAGLDLSRDLTLVEVKPAKAITDTYEMQHGKQRLISYEALQYEVVYEHADGMPLTCYFHLSNHGMAFRYELTELPEDSLTILEEISTYGFAASAKAWMQPMSKAKSGWKETNPSYEEHYSQGIPVDEKSPLGEGYVFPALFQTAEDTWLLLSETNVHRDYCGGKLKYDEDYAALRLTFPQAAEVFPGGGLLPRGVAPFHSPWRTIAIGDLAEVVANTLVTDLAAPAIAVDTDFIQSGLASWSWVLLKDDFTNYETSHQFIDYAAEMGWPYCLIDADWDWKIGYERMQELIDYAAGKNVKILLWYNSSGDWNSTVYTPKSKLVDADERKSEFARLKNMGVAGLKIDFFGGDGQSMIAYYHDLLKDAAAARLMLNFHGATLPRGWHRTYPNLMTVEAIKGQEFITFEQANADLQPSHCAVIPFTRNVYDPMDFTPMVLDTIPNIVRRTSTTFELALPVLFTSGIQHIAEIPMGMEKMPAYIQAYLKDIPTRWEESKLLAGYPGKEVIMARRKGDTWYIVGINGEASAKTFELDLSFVKHQEGLLFYDDASGIPAQKQVAAGHVQLELVPYGGFVIKI